MHRLVPTALLLLLAACGQAASTYLAPDFSLPVRQGWTVVQPPIAGFPRARVAFLKKDAAGGNVVLAVLRETLTEPQAANFAASVDAATAALPSYAEDGREELEVAGRTLALLSFHAVDQETGTLARFQQLAVTHNRTGYLLRARVPEQLDAKLAKELKEMFEGFVPTEPPAAAPPSATVVPAG